MLGLLLGAAVMGVIIAMMEEGEFPGWLNMILCVLAASLPAWIINNYILYTPFGILGLVVGAVTGGAAISALCGMSLQRASIAASIYLGIILVVNVALTLLLG